MRSVLSRELSKDNLESNKRSYFESESRGDERLNADGYQARNLMESGMWWILKGSAAKHGFED